MPSKEDSAMATGNYYYYYYWYSAV